MNLISNEDIKSLSIEKVWKLYEDYVNPGQVELINTFSFGNDLITKASGSWLYTEDKKILDMTGGKGVLNHGHNHPKILAARKEFQDSLKMEVHKNYFSPYLAALSANIATLLPEDLNKSYFVNSGSEAVEGALKMAYKYHNAKRDFVLHADISFHGKTIGAGSLTGSEEINFRFQEIPNKKAFKYNDINSIKKLVSELTKDDQSNIYAIIVEPFSAGSLLSCDRDFLIELREICFTNDIILIFDEVYTGWSKSGELFYFMKFDGLFPDVLTYSKSFGAGKSSISGYTTRDHVFNKSYGKLNSAILHSTTYNGFGEECVTALEGINIVVNDNYTEKAKNIENLILSNLDKLKSETKYIKDIYGHGAHCRFTPNYGDDVLEMAQKLLPSSIAKKTQTVRKIITGSIMEELYSEHNILTSFGSNKGIPLIISPSLIITEEEIELFFKSLKETLDKGLPELIMKFIKKKINSKF